MWILSIKQVRSAFALSLNLLALSAFAQTEEIDEFLGLDSEIKEAAQIAVPEIELPPQSVEVELPVLPKGQKHSLIPWSSQEPEDWLDINKWMLDRAQKDKDPDWKTRLRYLGQNELVGKVLQCRGDCRVFRGLVATKAEHLTRIHEGDEVVTGKDSVLWIFLADGTLTRLSAKSSVSFLEVNIGQTEVFYQARLNQGHIFWHPRDPGAMIADDGAETDSFSLPLLVRESNLEYFERQIYTTQDDQGHLKEIMSVDENPIKAQFDRLNKLKELNTSQLPLSTMVMLVAPNATVASRNTSFDLTYVPGGKAYLKKRSFRGGEIFDLLLRGYSNTDSIPVSDPSWHEVDPLGRNHRISTSELGHLEVLSLLTARIKTLELARELWIEKYTLPVMKAHAVPERLAAEHGYRFWHTDLYQRTQFLTEYTRRIETTQLKSVENLLAKIERDGTPVEREISAEAYQTCLNHYLFGLKTRYTNRQMRVREMNDLQYYVWILRNGKL
ncbi:MAG TPA: hypothetical protein VNJ01_03230 [Bacteriovoracaceae bacterium]|nr:hypothetical protein [Bacteriovoracaceae bacterium]